MAKLVGYTLKEIVWRLLPHFLSSGVVGLLVYWLTWIILLHIGVIVLGSNIALHIKLCLWLLSLSSSIAVHVLEDYTVNWF